MSSTDPTNSTRERVAGAIALAIHDGDHPRLIADAVLELLRSLEEEREAPVVTEVVAASLEAAAADLPFTADFAADVPDWLRARAAAVRAAGGEGA